MEIKYQIHYLEDAVCDHIPALSKSAKELIKRTIEERLVVDPVGYGKPLRYSLRGHRRLRVSDYRIIYRIEPDRNTVVIVAIKHRKSVYEDA